MSIFPVLLHPTQVATLITAQSRVYHLADKTTRLDETANRMLEKQAQMQSLISGTLTELKRKEYEKLKAEITEQLMDDFSDRNRSKHTPTFHRIISYLKESDATTMEEKTLAGQRDTSGPKLNTIKEEDEEAMPDTEELTTMQNQLSKANAILERVKASLASDSKDIDEVAENGEELKLARDYIEEKIRQTPRATPAPTRQQSLIFGTPRGSRALKEKEKGEGETVTASDEEARKAREAYEEMLKDMQIQLRDVLDELVELGEKKKLRENKTAGNGKDSKWKAFMIRDQLVQDLLSQVPLGDLPFDKCEWERSFLTD